MATFQNGNRRRATAIPGCTDEQIDSAINYLDGIRRRTAEQSNMREAAYIAIAAIHQCRTAVWGEEMRDYIDAPSAAQVIEGLESGGKVEQWNALMQIWREFNATANWWRGIREDDIPNPGYRLVPIPKPRTEKVPILEALERMPPGLAPVRFEKIIKNGYTASLVIIAGDHIFDPDDDGLIEVLCEDEP